MKTLVLNAPFHARYSRPQRSPAVCKSGTIYFPIWLAFSVGILEEDGHEVLFIDAPARDLTLNDVLNIAHDFAPALIVMDTSTPSITSDIGIAEELRGILPYAFIVMVGTHVSARPEETLNQCMAVNAVACREYDYTIRELANHMARTAPVHPNQSALRCILGLAFRCGNDIIRNPDRPLIEELDLLPWVSEVYKKHLLIEDYFNPNAPHPMVTLISSRGCPFQCSFCLYPQTLTGRRYRFRAISDVVEEMLYIEREYPQAKSIFFEDDTLTANKKRCIQLADAIIKQGVRIPWVANSRAELDYETMKKLKAAGCRELCVGFESGEQEVLDSMRKGTKLNRAAQFMSDARRAGILIHGCFMIGFPGETRESILNNTIKYAMRLNPDTVQFYPVMVYPGTEAYDEYKAMNWITTKNYTEWLTPQGLHNCVVRNEHLSSRDLVLLCDLGRRMYYLRPRYIAYKLFQVIKNPYEISRTIKAARTFFKYLVLGSRV